MTVYPMIRLGLLAVTLAFAGQGCHSQKSFASAEQAADSLVTALRAHDKAQLREILGSDSDKLISSGDEVQDRESGDRFLQAYDTKHSLAVDQDGSATMVVGAQDWPLPIPIVKDDDKGTWTFDTAAGMDEIVNRRIGRNELETIQTCLAVVDAQREYATIDPDHDGIEAYAQKFMSDPEKKNGLYWPTGPGEPQSPLGPLVGSAADEGYTLNRPKTAGPQPYHGYRYRLLKSQGPSARGGAVDYVFGKNMIGGFALVAWPAEYGASGIKTFIVNHDGVVFEQDLGDNTERTAGQMASFDPGPGWAPVDAAAQAPAAP